MNTIMHKITTSALPVLASGLLLASLNTNAASLREITSFGTNPTNLRMHLYVPDALPNNAPILVANHYCTGTGPALYSGTQFASLADRYGYIVIYPSATRSGQCFDVSSPQALRRGGGSDPVGIMSMVNYVQQNYNVDSTRIFVTGVSSGAMMTQVLLGLYPDVFKAGASFAGVPFACFATTNGSTWNSDCANGTISRTAQQWGDLVRNAYPGYTGARPRVQLWHGTADTTLRYPNFNEAIKQWTNVHGISQTPVSTDTPSSGATRTRYGTTGGQALVEAISLQGTGHNIPVNAAEAIRFFGLTSPVASSVASSRVPVSSSPASSSRSSVSSSVVTTSSARSSAVSSNPGTGSNCSYVITNNWGSGFTGAIRITNKRTTAINGWSVSWRYTNGTSLSGTWNATVTGSNPYSASNLSWNGSIQPGQTVEFGFQGNHNSAEIPTVTGAACN